MLRNVIALEKLAHKHSMIYLRKGIYITKYEIMSKWIDNLFDKHVFNILSDIPAESIDYLLWHRVNGDCSDNTIYKTNIKFLRTKFKSIYD